VPTNKLTLYPDHRSLKNRRKCSSLTRNFNSQMVWMSCLPIWAYDRLFYGTFLIRILSVSPFFRQFHKDTSDLFWLAIARLRHGLEGHNWTGLFHRAKEPFPDVNVICAFFFLLTKTISHVVNVCWNQKTYVFFLLLIPPSRKTRFKLIEKNRSLSHNWPFYAAQFTLNYRIISPIFSHPIRSPVCYKSWR